jgi:spore coat protein U-like protein
MRFNMSIKVSLACAVLTLGLLAAAPAQAQTTQPITATATVTDACTLGTAAGTLDFGSLVSGAVSVNEVSSINVICNPGAPWAVSAAVGAGAGETSANRLLAGTGANVSTISWALYQDGTCTAVWGDTTGTDTMIGTGNAAGTVENMPICARLIGNVTPNVPADTYTETVTITLSFT